MEKERREGIVEALLFSTGRILKKTEIMSILEISEKDVEALINTLKDRYSKENSGLQIISVKDGYQLATKKEYYEYLYPAFDNRLKPKLSQASLETLAIIAYNPRITRADIDMIRGVDTSGSVYKLLDYNLIEPAGKSDLPGKPMTFRTTDEFLKMFGLHSLEELPNLPKYKLDSNRQIVIDELDEIKDGEQANDSMEAPSPSEVQDVEDNN
jgi:segregation and condensation protein B